MWFLNGTSYFSFDDLAGPVKKMAMILQQGPRHDTNYQNYTITNTKYKSRFAQAYERNITFDQVSDI